MPSDDQGPTTHETHHLPCEIASVTEARSRLRDALEATAVDEQLADDAAAVLSELMMNAMLHGTPDASGCVRAAWSVRADGDEHEVVVEVRDAGRGAPRIEPTDEYAAAGRGMRLVDALCESWSVDHADGTAVTGRLRTRRDPRG